MADTVQAFQLGTSTVVTLPKKLGIKPGQRLKFKKSKGKIILEEKEDIKIMIKKLAGGMNFKKAFGGKITPEQLNKIFDEQYKKVLPRR